MFEKRAPKLGGPGFSPFAGIVLSLTSLERRVARPHMEAARFSPFAGIVLSLTGRNWTWTAPATSFSPFAGIVLSLTHG